MIIFFLVITVLIYILYRTKYFLDMFTDKLVFIKPKNWNNLPFQKKLYIYGKQLDEKYSLYADKLKVKDYIKSLKIKDLKIPKTLKILDKNLELKGLPENFIIKSNCGSGDIIIVENNKLIRMICKSREFYDLNEIKHWAKLSLIPHKTYCENHYESIEPYIFVEENLGSNISDFKFFCIKGNVEIVQIDNNRFINHCQNLYNTNFQLQPYYFKNKNCNFKIKKPKNFKKMIDIAEKISKKFDFCRIDLFNVNGNIYFGEITFVPEAARIGFKPLKYDYILGKKWN